MAINHRRPRVAKLPARSPHVAEIAERPGAFASVALLSPSSRHCVSSAKPIVRSRSSTCATLSLKTLAEMRASYLERSSPDEASSLPGGRKARKAE